jgi:UDP-N-acetylglucosamine 2-epimerase (non-hydrolysing)
VIQGLEPILQQFKPELVLVHGDTTTTFATSLAAYYQQISVAHVEAGLRSFDRTMPEEVNRVLTDAISDYLFTTEASAKQNLLREAPTADA